jgi:3-deoxy-7-phosphoheptulonate synthase
MENLIFHLLLLWRKVKRSIKNLNRDTHIRKGKKMESNSYDYPDTIEGCSVPVRANRKSKPDPTVVSINGIRIGSSEVVIIAGPCAVENHEQLLETARTVKASGGVILRGGAFKPRSSPYNFQGLGEEGIKMLREIGRETGLPIVTEVMDTRQVKFVAENADMLQIGSRNMQNYPLLKEVGMLRKPVLLKRGMMATIEEFLLAAEYILNQGNEQVVLCERGIRTFETTTRNTLDLSAVPMLKHLSHLPVIVDPSHGTGHRWMVPPMAKAAIAAGADGLIMEVHYKPEEALCDGYQSLSPDEFSRLMADLKKIAQAVGREIYQHE